MRGLVALAALALAGCGLVGGSAGDVCRAAGEQEVRDALGVQPPAAIGFTATARECTWSAPSPDGLPREMRARLIRPGDLRAALPPKSPTGAFEEELRLLEHEHPRTRVLGGLGDAAVIGFGAVEDERFSGGLVLRQKGDILVLRIEGEDPAAFEAAARGMATRLRR